MSNPVYDPTLASPLVTSEDSASWWETGLSFISGLATTAVQYDLSRREADSTTNSYYVASTTPTSTQNTQAASVAGTTEAAGMAGVFSKVGSYVGVSGQVVAVVAVGLGIWYVTKRRK